MRLGLITDLVVDVTDEPMDLPVEILKFHVLLGWLGRSMHRLILIHQSPMNVGMIWNIALVQPVNLPSNPVVCRSRPLVYVGIRSVNGIIIDSWANVADQLMHYPVDIGEFHVHQWLGSIGGFTGQLLGASSD